MSSVQPWGQTRRSDCGGMQLNTGTIQGKIKDQGTDSFVVIFMPVFGQSLCSF